MQELQQAMDEFLEELSRQAMQQGRDQQGQPPDDGRSVDRRDLQQMLDKARELMRSGARDAAREMLAQLQEMLENLRAGQQQAQPSAGERNLSDLQKMIQLQQQLLDRSFQMDREQRHDSMRRRLGQPRQGQRERQGQQQGQQQGQSGQEPGEEQPDEAYGEGENQAPASSGQAAGEQEGLRRALGELMRRMGEAGMEIPRAMGQAEMQMRSARESLQQGRPGVAADAQAQAVDAMQRAGQDMMQQLEEQMARQQGQGPGQAAQPRPSAQRGRVMGLWATNYQAGGLLATAAATFLLVHQRYRLAVGPATAAAVLPGLAGIALVSLFFVLMLATPYLESLGH